MAKIYSAIQTFTAAGGETSIVFNNIPQNYADLKFSITARTNRTNAADAVYWYYNTDTTSGNYSGKQMTGYGTSYQSTSNGYANEIMYLGGNSATSNTFGNGEFNIPNYTGSTAKICSIESVSETNAATAYSNLGSYLWTGTAAITRVTILPVSGTSFIAGSTFTLYGIGTGARATGGTFTSDGKYNYHTFLSTSNFLPTEQIKNAEVLIVSAGGGAGGNGGGGAGGVLYYPGQSLTAGTSYVCTIGSGGASGNPGATGGSSSFGSLLAPTGGGGGGVPGNVQNGTSGGSGGGGSGGYQSSTAGTGGTGIAGQGNNGGAGANGNGTGSGASNSGGGGGGAGGAGTAGTSIPIGGLGTSVYNAWHYATSTGVNIGGTFYIAGGGGGAGGYQNQNNYGFGGYGGGGAGKAGYTQVGGAGPSANNGDNGVANTGGGGGGGGTGQGGSGSTGGAGGSGLVIVRYPIAN